MITKEELLNEIKKYPNDERIKKEEEKAEIKEKKVKRSNPGSEKKNQKYFEIYVNDHHSHRERIKVLPNDTIKDLKILISSKIGTKPERIRLTQANRILNDKVTLDDYEIHHGIELYMSYQ